MLTAYAQAQSDSTSLSYYFDDGGISTGTMYKTDLVSMIHGDWPIIAENRLKNNLTLEMGAGLLMPYYVHDFLALAFTDNKGIQNDRFGYSTRLHVKWYTKAPERDYWGVQYYRRSFHHIKVNEWFFTKGDQRIIGKRLILDIALGLGVRLQRTDGPDYMFDPDFGFSPIMPLMIRFGVIP